MRVPICIESQWLGRFFTVAVRNAVGIMTDTAAPPCYSPRPSGLFRARTRPFGSSVSAVGGMERAGCDSRTVGPRDLDEKDDRQTPSTANSARLNLPVDDHHALPHRFNTVQRLSSRADHIFDMTALGSLPSALLARPLLPVFYSCFLTSGVSSVSEGFFGGFRTSADEM